MGFSSSHWGRDSPEPLLHLLFKMATSYRTRAAFTTNGFGNCQVLNSARAVDSSVLPDPALCKKWRRKNDQIQNGERCRTGQQSKINSALLSGHFGVGDSGDFLAGLATRMGGVQMRRRSRSCRAQAFPFQGRTAETAQVGHFKSSCILLFLLLSLHLFALICCVIFGGRKGS